MTSAVTRTGRAGALYDLLVTALFATPWTATLAFDLLRHLHETLGLPGTPPPHLTGTPLLMTTLFGVVVTMWSIARWLHPAPLLITLDTAGRLAFASWFLWALTQGESRVLAGFLALELLWAGLQARSLLTHYRPSRAHQ